MKTAQIAAQLYTVRDFLKTPSDIHASLKKVAAIGFRAVQVSGMGPIPEAELAAACKDLGLTICSTHEDGAKIVSDPATVADRLQKLGCTHTAYPYPKVPITTEAEAVALARSLDAAGKVLREAGITLAYHNHALELRRAGRRTMLDILYDESDPRHLEAELDTYWIQMGGASPLRWIRKVAGRMQVVHLKDAGVPCTETAATFCEIGNGNLDWNELIPALDQGACRWFVIEQDKCPGDPFASLAQSFQYLRRLAVDA